MKLNQARDAFTEETDCFVKNPLYALFLCVALLFVQMPSADMQISTQLSFLKPAPDYNKF